jgi:non-specific serine/threonine protein kinase
VRLLTLIGSPGVGKTRLALHVASNIAPMFGDGVRVVELASLRDAALVLPTIARALDIPETSGASLLATLQQVLSNQHLLLVLDNAEQVGSWDGERHPRPLGIATDVVAATLRQPRSA